MDLRKEKTGKSHDPYAGDRIFAIIDIQAFKIVQMICNPRPDFYDIISNAHKQPAKHIRYWNRCDIVTVPAACA